MGAQAPTKPFSFFLPLKLYQKELDLRRLTNINLKSIEVFFDPQLLQKVIIAVRKIDIPAVERSLIKSKTTLPVEVVSELDIVPSLSFLGGIGWFRQQVLKLYSWKVVNTPYVILLDDDVLMTRPTGLNELTIDGKLVMSHLHADGFRSYLDCSCPILKYDASLISPNQRVMNVTPEIMVTRELKELVLEISRLWQLRDGEQTAEFLLRVSREYVDHQPQTFVQKLYERLFYPEYNKKRREWKQQGKTLQNWSEYTLYWVYLLKHGRTNLYYDYNRNPGARQLNDEGVWFEAQARELGIDSWMSRTFAVNHDHCFAMFSARIENINRHELYHRIEEYLDNTYARRNS